MSNLRSALDDLARRFTDGVLAAVRSANMEELVAESGGAGGGRRRAAGGGGQPDPLRKARTGKGGRLARRSPEDIAKAVDRVVALVKTSKNGMRSEEIRKALGLDVREVPRILKTAVASKKLKARGQKRATEYSVR
jgi:hypothetical protein